MYQSDSNGANAFAGNFHDDGTAEHVLLEADEIDFPDSAETPTRAVRELEIRDRARRIVTAMTIYANGKLELERRRRGKPGDPRSLDLTYLDPAPRLERRLARRAGRAALVSGSVAALATTLAGLGLLGVVTVPAAAAAWACAAGAGLAFVYMSSETVVFVTRHGQVAVLTLTATPGSFTAQRKAVPLIAEAIKQASSRSDGNTQRYLKAEMREHYRLRGEGMLTPEDCSTGTARVLRQFDATG